MRCGKEIFTTTLPGITGTPSYKRYGKICSACFTDEERESLSREQILETAQSARRYRIIAKIDWRTLDVSEAEEKILRFLATRIFYTGTLPSGGDIRREFGDMEIEEHLAALERRGFIGSLF
jgi:hypothetical protein